MRNNNSKKIFEGLISRTKIYLVLIAILLIVICILDIRYFTPSTLFSSKGSPPRIERPLIYSGSIDLSILSIISSISFTPWLKSQAS